MLHSAFLFYTPYFSRILLHSELNAVLPFAFKRDLGDDVFSPKLIPNDNHFHSSPVKLQVSIKVGF